VAWDEQSVLMVSGGFCPERIASGEQELERVVNVLRELGERTCQAFMLYRVEHMRQADIAKVMGVSVSAVEKHLARAAAHLAHRAADPVHSTSHST
jgi:RNA polymerase sigma-70 factor (ECF subfamily)